MSVSVEHLCFSYGQRQVLHDVSLTVNRGELAIVLGPNGVGKSTLFRCMLGLAPPGAGQIRLQGENIAGLSPGRLARMIAYVPQSSYPAFKLFGVRHGYDGQNRACVPVFRTRQAGP